MATIPRIGRLWATLPGMLLLTVNFMSSTSAWMGTLTLVGLRSTRQPRAILCFHVVTHGVMPKRVLSRRPCQGMARSRTSSGSCVSRRAPTHAVYLARRDDSYIHVDEDESRTIPSFEDSEFFPSGRRGSATQAPTTRTFEKEFLLDRDLEELEEMGGDPFFFDPDASASSVDDDQDGSDDRHETALNAPSFPGLPKAMFRMVEVEEESKDVSLQTDELPAPSVPFVWDGVELENEYFDD